MRKRAGRLLATFLSLVLVIMCMMGNSTRVLAQGGVYVINPDPEVIVLVPGETTKVKVPIRAVGADINSPSFMADNSDTPYTITHPVLHTEGLDVQLDSVFQYFNQYLEFDITV